MDRYRERKLLRAKSLSQNQRRVEAGFCRQNAVAPGPVPHWHNGLSRGPASAMKCDHGGDRGGRRPLREQPNMVPPITLPDPSGPGSVTGSTAQRARARQTPPCPRVLGRRLGRQPALSLDQAKQTAPVGRNRFLPMGAEQACKTRVYIGTRGLRITRFSDADGRSPGHPDPAT